jgi:hypothetical protein
VEYVRREDFRTWCSEVGYLYVVVAAFVTIAMLMGSLGSYIGSVDLRDDENRRLSAEYLGPEAHVVPAAYP